MNGRAPAGVEEPREQPGLLEAWLGVNDDLLAGVGHALNNRVAALTAVGQVLAAGTEGPLSAALSAESARLQRSVQLLRLLVRRWGDEPEPIHLPDVLGDVAELLSHHPELHADTLDVEVEPGLSPVLGERSSLTHALCIVLIPAAVAAERAGEGTLRVRCSGTPTEVRLEVPCPAPPANRAGEGEALDQPPAAAMDPRAARGLIERAGGVLSVREEAGAITGLLVVLPTLAELRRREREGPPAPPASPG